MSLSAYIMLLDSIPKTGGVNADLTLILGWDAAELSASATKMWITFPSEYLLGVQGLLCVVSNGFTAAPSCNIVSQNVLEITLGTRDTAVNSFKLTVQQITNPIVEGGTLNYQITLVVIR